MSTRTTTLRIAILAVLCGTSISLAQGPPFDETLRGPKVNDRAVPGASTQFGEPMGKPDKFHRDDHVAHRQFMEAVRSLEDPALAADLRLTDAQRSQIDTIDSEFRASVDAFRAEHQAEIDELRAKVGEMRDERRERGQRPDGPPDKAAAKETKRALKEAKSDPQVQAAREKLKSLKEAGPNPQDANTRMWAVLTPAQQSLVQSRIDSMKDKKRERDGDEMRDRRGPGPDGDRGPQGDRPRNDQRPREDGQRPDRGPEGRRGPGGSDGPPPPPRAQFDRGPDGPRGEGFRDGPPPRGERFDRGPRGDRGPDGPPRGDRSNNPRLAHLIDRFNALPPEAQDRIIDRLEDMLARIDERGGRRERGGPKPPPPMDDVNVPPPDDDAGDPMPPPAPEHL